MPITEVDKIWFNGELVDWKNAKVHVLTHALHYGSGVFEGMRCYKAKNGPAVFRNREHMQRLENSAKTYYMELPYTVDELMKAAKDVVRVNKLDSAYIRPIAFRGYGEMGLNPLNAVVDVAIAAWPWGTYLGDEGLEKGIRVNISSLERINPKCIPPSAKACGQYINSILAKVESLKKGFDEALMLDNRGLISEGPGENLFMVKDGSLITPPLSASILPGITRDSIIQIAKDKGIDVWEKDIEKETLLSADELFFTGSAAEVTPIRQVDDTEIGEPGPVTKKLQDAYFKAVKGGDEKHEDWVDYI